MPTHGYRFKRALVGAAMAVTVMAPAIGASAQSLTLPYRSDTQWLNMDEQSLRSSYVNLLNQQYREFQNDTTGIQGLTLPRGIVSYVLSREQNVGDRQFVTDLYNLLLGRTPSSSEITYWTDRLDSGQTRRSVIINILQSDEFRDRWDDGNNNGDNDNRIINRVLNATQYYSHTNFVRYLYTELLDRNGSDSEVQYWVNQLNSGVSRRSVIQSFLDSSEYDDDDDHSVQSILNATQYYSNMNFVQYLYNELLNRNGSTSEVQYWVNQLNSGVNRQSVIQNFLNSAENQNL